jgi:hypothetical protein
MVKRKTQHLYDDIINLQHPTSARHPRMSAIDRAAQFSPFAALNGYEEAVKETSRITDQKIELSEDEKSILDDKLKIIETKLGSTTVFHFTYFVPDERKNGGAYVIHSGTVSKLDLNRSIIFLSDHTVIEINQIIAIDSEIFEDYGI